MAALKIPRSSLALIGALAGLTACSSPNTKFYTLSTMPPAKALPSSTGATVGVGRLSLPETLDRPQVVRRASDSRLDVDDFSRWGGPLSDGIGRVLTDDLRLRLGADRVAQLSVQPVMKPAYDLEIVFDRLDGDVAGNAYLQAQWTLSFGVASREIAVQRTSRHTESGEATIDGDVAAMSRLVGRLADDIAAAAATLPPQPAAARPTPLSAAIQQPSAATNK